MCILGDMFSPKSSRVVALGCVVLLGLLVVLFLFRRTIFSEPHAPEHDLQHLESLHWPNEVVRFLV